MIFRRVALGMFLSCAAASAAGAQAPDSAAIPAHPVQKESLFGLDKPRHFLLSAFIQSASFASIQAAGGSRHTAMLGAVSVTAVFGVGREIHDRRTKGLFSFGDLVWDALGAGTAVAMLRHTYR